MRMIIITALTGFGVYKNGEFYPVRIHPCYRSIVQKVIKKTCFKFLNEQDSLVLNGNHVILSLEECIKAHQYLRLRELKDD